MSLKRSYATEADVPTERKADYVPKDGRYVLDVEGFENIDSVLAKNTELLGKVSGHASELSGKQAEVDRLTRDLASANVVPRGQKAAPAAVVELGEAVAAAGITTPDAFKTLHAEHGTFKTTAEAATRREKLDGLRKRLGWNENAVGVLELVPNMPDVEDRDVTANGKTEKVPHAKLVTKNAAGQDEVSWKPYGEWFKENHAALLPSVTAKSGPVIATQGVGDPPADTDMIEQRRAQREKARTEHPNALMPQKAPAQATA
jgi:hypothetical protein